ncbi:hypothetical protein D3C85_1829360 [compost metagenome]
MSALDGGSDSTRTLKLTVVVSPGAIVPIEMPPAGNAAWLDTPLIVTDPGTKEEPGGMASVNTVLVTAAMPVFVTLTE